MHCCVCGCVWRSGLQCTNSLCRKCPSSQGTPSLVILQTISIRIRFLRQDSFSSCQHSPVHRFQSLKWSIISFRLFSAPVPGPKLESDTSVVFCLWPQHNLHNVLQVHLFLAKQFKLRLAFSALCHCVDPNVLAVIWRWSRFLVPDSVLVTCAVTITSLDCFISLAVTQSLSPETFISSLFRPKVQTGFCLAVKSDRLEKVTFPSYCRHLWRWPPSPFPLQRSLMNLQKSTGRLTEQAAVFLLGFFFAVGAGLGGGTPYWLTVWSK